MIARLAGALAGPARPEETSGERAGRGGAVPLIAIAAVFVAAAWLAQRTLLNHDSGWYLQATRMLLDGARLYQDIIEINPPLAFFLHVPPVWLAGLTGVSPIVMFFLWVFALLGGSLVLCQRVIAGLPLGAPERAALLAAALVALLLGSWQGIGQREHFLMIFTVPYLFLAAARATGRPVSRRIAIATGLFAAFGFALKPHFLLVPLAIEGYLWLTARRSVRLFRAETLTLGGLIVAYWAFVALATPLYFTRIVPWAFAVYEAYSGSASRMLGHPETLLLPLAIGVFLWARRPGALRAVAEIFLLAAVCFAVVYLAQSKGFSYHRFPIRTCLIVALGASLVAAIGAQRRQEGGFRHGLPALASGVLLAFYLGWLGLVGGYKSVFFHADGLPAMRASVASGARTLYVFSSNVWQAFPAANYAGLRSVSRYPTHWLLPGIVRQQAAGHLSPAEKRTIGSYERYIRDSVVEDFRRGKPDLVLVDVRKGKPYFGGISFDYVKYFTRDPRFAAIWSKYDRVGAIAGFDLYRRRR